MSNQIKYAVAIVAAVASIPLLAAGITMNSPILGAAALSAATWSTIVAVSHSRAQQRAERQHQQEGHSGQQDHLAAGS